MRKAAALSPDQAKAALSRLPGWALAADGKSISKEYSLEGFTAAAEFIGKIAPEADGMDHHPDLHLTRYRRLQVVLTSHFAGGLTENDVELALKIESLPRKEKP